MELLTMAGAALVGLVLVGVVVLMRSRRRESKPWARSEKLTLVGIMAAAAVGITGIVVPRLAGDGDDPPDIRVSLAASRLNPAGNDDPAAEYVCIVNEDPQAIALTGWTLRTADHVVNTLPPFRLERRALVRVHPGRGSDSKHDLFGITGRPAWRNEAGSVGLFDDDGEMIDSESYGVRDDADGGGTCGPSLAIDLSITHPEDGAVVRSRTVVIAGTVTPESVVRAQIDRDNESDFVGGERARLTHRGGLDDFEVPVALELGPNSIRVGAEKPGAEPVLKYVAVIRKKKAKAPTTPRCDPNYEGACVPSGATGINCTDIEERDFASVGTDPHGLDSDGDDIACE